jgi:hypothetical protein
LTSIKIPCPKTNSFQLELNWQPRSIRSLKSWLLVGEPCRLLRERGRFPLLDGPLPSPPRGRGTAPAFSSAEAGRAFARRRVMDAQGAKPATARRRVRVSPVCARPFAAHHALVKAFGNDHATSRTSSRNRSGDSRTMPFGNRVTAYAIRFHFLAAKLACLGNQRIATGKAALATALRCFWLHAFDPPHPRPL